MTASTGWSRALAPAKPGAGAINSNGLEGVVARNGHIWIADTYNNRVVLYRWAHP